MKRWFLLAAVAATLIIGCDKKDDVIAQAEKKDAAKGVAAPSIEETKAIAEEGFIYGLPLVMNYAVMNEYAVDKTVQPVQGAVQPDQQRAPRLHLRGHGGHHAEQRHALLDALAGSARRADGALGAGGGQEALLLGAADRRQYLQLSATSAAARPATSRATTSSSARTGRARRRAGIKKVFHSTTPFALAVFRTQLFNPADMPNVVKVQAGYKAQPLSAFLQAARAAGRAEDRFPPGHHRGHQGELLRVSRRRPAVRARRRRKTRTIRAKLASIGIGPGKTFDVQGSLAEHKAAVLLGMKEGDDKVDKFLAERHEEHQRLERSARFFGDRDFYKGNWLMRAAAAKGGIYGNDAVEAMYPLTRVDCDGRDARRQQAQLHAHLPRRAAAAGECLLVGDDVRRQEPVPDQEPDQSLSHQLADAAAA